MTTFDFLSCESKQNNCLSQEATDEWHFEVVCFPEEVVYVTLDKWAFLAVLKSATGFINDRLSATAQANNDEFSPFGV